MEKIGRYKIVAELGRGGMATVYRAIDPSFEREVAVKVLPREFLHDPQFRERFRREAKVVAALEHAAIVPVYDFGEDEGMPYIVMRLMAGGSLADKLREQGKFCLEDAAEVVLRMLSALDAAHRTGVIHRDLKPGNILFDQYDNAFLSDFGIARIVKAGTTLTGDNILGTPAYMSPEQVQGDKEIDGRSDIYSLGIIFYQMLTGAPPYQASTPAKVMMMHVLEPVPNLMRALPALAPQVEAWFEKVLAKDPDDRFGAAREAGDALRAAMRSAAAPTRERIPRPADVQRTVVDTTPPPFARITPPPRTPPPMPPPSQSPPGGTPYPSAPYPGGSAPVSTVQAASSRKRWLPIGVALFALACIAVFLFGGLAFFASNGSGPLAGMFSTPIAPATDAPLPPSDTPLPVAPTPSDTPAAAEQLPAAPPPTDVPLPTDTPTPTLTPTPEALVIGGADKIAFIDNNEIWLMNVDGSDLQQLTNDGAQKTRLHWLPDGSALTYISGKCAWQIDYQTGQQDFLACFESARYLDEFIVSNDGSRVAISLNLELFVVPFDRDSLAEARSRSNLIAMSDCEVLAPLRTNTGASVAVTQVRWSADDTKLAIKVLAPMNGLQVDLIRYTDISSCKYTNKLDEFPASRFQLDGYNKTPYIQNFGFDGLFLFAMHSYTRNDGYGYLYIYNTDLYRADSKISPVGLCCYRDPDFSPDGRYFIFAYQPFEAGARTRLYYVPYAQLSSGADFEPLPLPDDFFANPKVKPIPVLRPVDGGE